VQADDYIQCQRSHEKARDIVCFKRLLSANDVSVNVLALYADQTGQSRCSGKLRDVTKAHFFPRNAKCFAKFLHSSFHLSHQLSLEAFSLGKEQYDELPTPRVSPAIIGCR